MAYKFHINPLYRILWICKVQFIHIYADKSRVYDPHFS